MQIGLRSGPLKRSKEYFLGSWYNGLCKYLRSQLDFHFPTRNFNVIFYICPDFDNFSVVTFPIHDIRNIRQISGGLLNPDLDKYDGIKIGYQVILLEEICLILFLKR